MDVLPTDAAWANPSATVGFAARESLALIHQDAPRAEHSPNPQTLLVTAA